MARTGDDPRLAQMLLEVASDMDAEADAIEAASSLATVQSRPVALSA
jgi:hypothetical protein